MNMNKILKRVLILFLAISLLLPFGNTLVYAGQSGQAQLGEAVSNLNNPTDDAYKTLKEIMEIMAWVGFAIAIFKLIQIGITYMTGVASKRSNASASLLPWLIGCIVCALFGVLGPWFIDLFASADDGDIFNTIFTIFR